MQTLIRVGCCARMRRGIPCRTFRGWHATRRVASIGQREVQFQEDGGCAAWRAETMQIVCDLQRRAHSHPARVATADAPETPVEAARGCIAKRGLLLRRGREDFSDFESSLPRLKSTHVADCKPQAPPGRRWDFALELGLGLFLQNTREPAGWLRS